MVDVQDCHAMERLCSQRAEADPTRAWKWLGQAERWRELGKREVAWRFQRRNAQQQMNTEPMQMGTNTINRSKQQG